MRNDQYTATLESLKETCDEAIKLYLTRKTQGWFWRWGCPCISAAAASPAPCTATGAAPGAAGASTQAKDTAPVPSVNEGGAEIISPELGNSNQASSPTLPLETLSLQGRA